MFSSATVCYFSLCSDTSSQAPMAVALTRGRICTHLPIGAMIAHRALEHKGVLPAQWSTSSRASSRCCTAHSWTDLPPSLGEHAIRTKRIEQDLAHAYAILMVLDATSAPE